jgi:hypothetical protein
MEGYEQITYIYNVSDTLVSKYSDSVKLEFNTVFKLYVSITNTGDCKNLSMEAIVATTSYRLPEFSISGCTGVVTWVAKQYSPTRAQKITINALMNGYQPASKNYYVETALLMEHVDNVSIVFTSFTYTLLGSINRTNCTGLSLKASTGTV